MFLSLQAKHQRLVMKMKRNKQWCDMRNNWEGIRRITNFADDLDLRNSKTKVLSSRNDRSTSFHTPLAMISNKVNIEKEVLKFMAQNMIIGTEWDAIRKVELENAKPKTLLLISIHYASLPNLSSSLYFGISMASSPRSNTVTIEKEREL